MESTHYDLRQLSQGQVIEVTLIGNSANILLLDNSNFSNYKNGRPYKYYGGNMTTSVSRLLIPNAGHWHVVIDLKGHSGSVESSVQVLPK